MATIEIGQCSPGSPGENPADKVMFVSQKADALKLVSADIICYCFAIDA